MAKTLTLVFIILMLCSQIAQGLVVHCQMDMTGMAMQADAMHHDMKQADMNHAEMEHHGHHQADNAAQSPSSMMAGAMDCCEESCTCAAGSVFSQIVFAYSGIQATKQTLSAPVGMFVIYSVAPDALIKPPKFA